MDECLLLLPANPPFMLNVPPSKLSTSNAMAIESKPSTSGATQPTLSDMMDLLQAAADYIRFYITKIVLNKILKRLRSIRS
ncbi:hypothetical protein RGQ29_023215 [Quercus rubra]|uniref:Uncharacterized protein n=1 Tax=Quercus rubra TaxID=3512 RepID=A0AAN7ITY8_QUERU|nr:hypothetical protein RGQ29_004048 [Quercus rubra]KAK4585926.1 hypothetical protein RGQ29_023215 [Quercus rubra]